LTIIEEAIKYIDKLHSTLLTRLHNSRDGELTANHSSTSTALLYGQNATGEAIALSQTCAEYI